MQEWVNNNRAQCRKYWRDYRSRNLSAVREQQRNNYRQKNNVPPEKFRPKLSQTAVLEMRAKFAQGISLGVLTTDYKVNVQTAYDAILGRTWRKLPLPDYSQRKRPNRGRHVHPSNSKPLSTHYPYLINDTNEHYQLVRAVDQAVPKTLNEDMRADICQELLLSIICGSLTTADLSRDLVNQYIRTAYKSLGNRFKELSLDGTSYSQRTGRAYSLIDLLATPPNETWAETETPLYQAELSYTLTRSRPAFPYGSPLSDATSTQDLAERLQNVWEANRLLTERIPNPGIHFPDRTTDNRNKTASLGNSGHRRMRSSLPRNRVGLQRPPAHPIREQDELFFARQEYQEHRADEDRQ